MYETPDGHRTFLVAIEGADRVGKATQSILLADALRRRRFSVMAVEVPYADKVTHPEIYRMLKDGSVKRFPSVFQTLQVVNRRIFQTYFLPPLAKHSDVLVFDRWTLSTVVYGSVGGVSSDETEEILRGILKPDVTVVLDAPAWPATNLDVLETDQSFQRAVRNGYVGACRTSDHILINAARDREDVHRDVLSVVLERLGSFPMSSSS
jgi:thymidylate kinase